MLLEIVAISPVTSQWLDKDTFHISGTLMYSYLLRALSGRPNGLVIQQMQLATHQTAKMRIELFSTHDALQCDTTLYCRFFGLRLTQPYLFTMYPVHVRMGVLVFLVE